MNKNIYVTQPHMPPLDEYMRYLEQIWQNKQLTNNGKFHQQLESELAEYLGVKYISFFANGTIALVTALQALRITGEVITTPYSFVATAHALLWNHLKPVFVDIEKDTCNIDPEKIIEAITPHTTAIMPVHCYGNPCEVEQIQHIADTYGLRVIYDAAHAFGVDYKGQSLLLHGDLPVLSFHATKVFTTFEGGAIVCHDAKTKKRIDYFKNFGFADEVTVVAPGINGKMNEMQAAFGLLLLKHIDNTIKCRKHIDYGYREGLHIIQGIRYFEYHKDSIPNYTYFPVFIGKEYPLSRDELYQKLKDKGIHARRYFYPLISEFPMYRCLSSSQHDNLPIAHSVADSVLCLPIYPDLLFEKYEQIIDIITKE